MKYVEESKKKPKITIVIPVYNGENYIKLAIESALAQTYDNFEVLIIDDGSTDGTKRIVDSFNNKKIRYIKKENGGVSSALNLALKEMRGSYFSWLSHDDTYEPTKLEEEVEYLEVNNLFGKKIVLYSDYYLIDEKGHRTHAIMLDHEDVMLRPEFTLLKGRIDGLTLLIPKRAFDECGDFDEELACVQDYEMWQRMMMRGYSFVHIPKLLVSTRIHKKQTTQINPKVVDEGNDFYRKALAQTTEKQMEQCVGSEYNFLVELANFHKNTVYKEFGKECAAKAQKIMSQAKEKTAQQKVSVIFSASNDDKKEDVKQALDSVVNQTHKNIELIMICDGIEPSDIEKYADGHRIELLTNPARRRRWHDSVTRGIENATGDYVAFLSTSGNWTKDKLEKQLQHMIAAKANMSYTPYGDGEADNKELKEEKPLDGNCKKEMVFACNIAKESVMLKMDFVKRHWGSFKEAKWNNEDILWLLLMRDGKEYLCRTKEPLLEVKDASPKDNKTKEALKEKIHFLLSDEKYCGYDREISKVMKDCAECIDRSEVMFEPFSGNNKIEKLLFFIKNEGIRNTGRRIVKKIGGERSA